MSHRTILLCMLLSTCLVVAGFEWKIRREWTPVDPYVAALQLLRERLPAGTTLTLYADTLEVEHLIRARFALAPVRLVPSRQEQPDTSLVILNVVNRDTAWRRFLEARRVLWHYRDKANKYYLVRR